MASRNNQPKYRSYDDYLRAKKREEAEKNSAFFEAMPTATNITPNSSNGAAIVRKPNEYNTITDNDRLIAAAMGESSTADDEIYGPKMPEAETEAAESTESIEVPKYQEHWDKEKELYEQYLNRSPFEYDVNADELYQMYHSQALKDAENSRRDAVARAAGLTGGYGSTYAATAGNAAYSDVMEGMNDIAPELYQAAYDRYNDEGEKMLSDAEIHGALGDKLYAESPEGLLAAAAAEGDSTGDSTKTDFEQAQRVKNGKAVYDADGKNNSGATIYSEAMRLFVDGEYNGYTEDQIRDELMTWEYADKDGNPGELLTEADVNYLIDQIVQEREIAYLGGLVDSNGVSLWDFVNGLSTTDDFDTLYSKLSAWKDKDGQGLTDEEMLTIILSISQ